MCDFYSAVANRSKVYHDSSNSHSKMIETLGWKENTRERTYFWEFELDVSKTKPTMENIVRRGTNPDKIPEKVMRNVLNHYQIVYDVLHGNVEIPEFMKNGKYSDVLSRLSVIPENIQEILSKDENYNVRWNLAGNNLITEKIQEILSKDENYNVRWNLAGNNSITEKIQKTLSKDENYYVRYNLARNNSITEKIKSSIKL